MSLRDDMDMLERHIERGEGMDCLLGRAPLLDVNGNVWAVPVFNDAGEVTHHQPINPRTEQ
ncbi:hypothetical protein [uncultured Planktomarina sp.]|uniref:hypothetical protein n=1 Tax=uncultured Planktomarina sp. TaxID=1538529 RepID=UPI00326168C1